MKKKFSLVARVSTDNPRVIGAALRKIITNGTVKRMASNEFLVRAELLGENAKELNRSLLSGLRSVERKTRLRAEWESGSVIEKFFDYVPKSKTAK
jgi:hypothetical protein